MGRVAAGAVDQSDVRPLPPLLLRFCTRARSLLDVRKAAMTADMLRCDAQIDDIGFVIDEAEQAQV